MPEDGFITKNPDISNIRRGPLEKISEFLALKRPVGSKKFRVQEIERHPLLLAKFGGGERLTSGDVSFLTSSLLQTGKPEYWLHTGLFEVFLPVLANPLSYVCEIWQGGGCQFCEEISKFAEFMTKQPEAVLHCKYAFLVRYGIGQMLGQCKILGLTSEQKSKPVPNCHKM